MRIFLSHPVTINYEEELYEPIITADFYKEHEIIMPHIVKESNSKEQIRTCDVFIAGISKPALGVGIEIGWANAFEKPIYFIYKDGSNIPGSVRFISTNMFSYGSKRQLLRIFSRIIKHEISHSGS